MKTYLIYKGYKVWDEIDPNPAEIQETVEHGTRTLRYHGRLLHEVDPAKTPYFYYRFPDQINWLSRESFRRAFDMD